MQPAAVDSGHSLPQCADSRKYERPFQKTAGSTHGKHHLAKGAGLRIRLVPYRANVERTCQRSGHPKRTAGWS